MKSHRQQELSQKLILETKLVSEKKPYYDFVQFNDLYVIFVHLCEIGSKVYGFMKINPILLFQTADVTLMGLPLWNVENSMVIALAKRDLQDYNVMNAKQMLLVTSVMHVNQTSSIIHLVITVISRHIFWHCKKFASKIICHHFASLSFEQINIFFHGFYFFVDVVCRI